MSDVIRKQFVSEITKAPGAGDRVRRFVISTASVDRDNDTIAVAGWKLDSYKRNPVVLWAHDYSQLPIGKATGVGIENGKLVATAEFADHDFADTVLRLIDGGFLNATSVGFRPIKSALNRERGGQDFIEQELLEFSIVPVPANSEALRRAAKALGFQRAYDLTEFDADVVRDVVADVLREPTLWRDGVQATRRRLADDPVRSVAVCDMDATEILRVVRGVTADAIREVAAQATADALNRHRGRLD